MLDILALFFFLTGPQPRVANAPAWTCAPERWVQGPKYEDGQFKGTLETECEVRDAFKGGVTTLEQSVRTTIANGAKTIHSGPTPGKWSGLPSNHWDVTVEIKDPKSTITVRQDSHLATDLKTRLQYATISTRLVGTGDAEPLRKLDNLMEAESTPIPGHYRVKLGGTLWAKKPWYAPTSVFMKEVEKAAISAFQKGRDNSMPTIASSL